MTGFKIVSFFIPFLKSDYSDKSVVCFLCHPRVQGKQGGNSDGWRPSRPRYHRVHGAGLREQRVDDLVEVLDAGVVYATAALRLGVDGALKHRTEDGGRNLTPVKVERGDKGGETPTNLVISCQSPERAKQLCSSVSCLPPPTAALPFDLSIKKCTFAPKIKQL